MVECFSSMHEALASIPSIKRSETRSSAGRTELVRDADLHVPSHLRNQRTPPPPPQKSEFYQVLWEMLRCEK